jgi:hypothetical protein
MNCSGQRRDTCCGSATLAKTWGAMLEFSGYRGSKPFLGEVDGKQFRVIQRIYTMRAFSRKHWQQMTIFPSAALGCGS